jgi:hypothetical protein
MTMLFRPLTWRLALAAGLLLVAALAVTSCGKGSGDAPATFAKGLQGPGVPASSVSVIESWANALRDGHAKQAAAYWAHPSEMVNGPDESGHLTLIRIRSERDAELADETLSCGARLHATVLSGGYVRAVFLLGVRSGAGASKRGCSGPAGVDFLIRSGHIVRWVRAPVGGGGSESPPGGEAELPGSAAGARPA